MEVSEPGATEAVSGGAFAGLPPTPSLREYLALQPVDLESAIRLYVAFGAAAAFRAFRPQRFRGMGQFVLGRRLLRIQSEGLVFAVRPRTEDLGYLRPSQKRTVERWFRPASGEFVVDAGAHVGLHALRAARSGSRVLAVEPNPEAADSLRTSAAWNGLTNVEVVAVALGSERGRGVLEVPAVWDGKASLIPGWATGGHPDGTFRSVAVPISPLDDLTAADSTRAVDWLLIDVEGSELDLLRGAAATLRRTRHIILEVSFASLPVARRRLEEEFGFEILAVEPQTNVTLYLVARKRASEDPGFGQGPSSAGMRRT
ncbi:MAG: FkbM family methyltransferase [Thermoplasmata archaeon]|nr:FkbM family methyltransferase [Thermoplasmata archaeon]